MTHDWSNPLLYSAYDYVDTTTSQRRVNDGVIRSLLISLGQEISRLNREVDELRKKVEGKR